MMSRITDPDVQMLATIAGTLKPDYAKTGMVDPWAGSPFAWIRDMRSPRRKGKIGEQLIAGWCAAKGLGVGPSTGAGNDRTISGVRVEIKFSMEWESGIYNFQQIRDQAYEHVVCLGISPFDARCWVVPKGVIRRRASGQHTGKSARDTLWLMFPAAHPPRWLGRYGGTLAAAYALLRGIK